MVAGFRLCWITVFSVLNKYFYSAISSKTFRRLKFCTFRACSNKYCDSRFPYKFHPGIPTFQFSKLIGKFCENKNRSKAKVLHSGYYIDLQWKFSISILPVVQGIDRRKASAPAEGKFWLQRDFALPPRWQQSHPSLWSHHSPCHMLCERCSQHKN